MVPLILGNSHIIVNHPQPGGELGWRIIKGLVITTFCSFTGAETGDTNSSGKLSFSTRILSVVGQSLYTRELQSILLR